MIPFPKGAVWLLCLVTALLLFRDVYSEGRVVCYYTNWSVYRPGTAKFNPQNINPYLCTHLIYAFAGFTKDNTLRHFDKYQDLELGGYSKFTGLKSYNKNLKTMVAVGGWNEASSRFSPLVANPERRQQFVKNILKFLRQNHFDGLDLDWEYPAYRDGGKPRDRDNYAQFVQELRSEFDRESAKTGRPRLLLTMAVPAGVEYIEKGYDIPKLNKYLDWFNLLSYDYHSAYEPSVNHHAPLYPLEEESEYNYDSELNIDYSVKFYLAAGADRDKLVLGIPTYGRSYTLVNEDDTEIGAPADGPGSQGDATREKGYLAYYEICQNIRDDPDWVVVQPNPKAMGPYAHRGDQWVGYDDEAIARKKAEYVADNGLGGIMFWSIDNDDFRGTCSGKPYPLIEAAKEALLDRLGVSDNEVSRPSKPRKPSRSRSQQVSNRNQITAETRATEKPVTGSRKSSSRRPHTRRPSSTTTTTTSSLYVGGRTTTPAPPTTPDPGSDFKCEEEGFFSHPRDCKKYFWCLDSGPSNLGIVAHQFTCPSGLYFNTAADSCDFTRNVLCKKSTTATTAATTTTKPTTTTSTTTTQSPRVTAATSRYSFLQRTSTTASPDEYDEVEYEDEVLPNSGFSRGTDTEEDPRVIKELIDLIKKVGGIEELEKQLLLQDDGSMALKDTKTQDISTTPSSISKSLFSKVLNRPNAFNSLKNRLSGQTGKSTHKREDSEEETSISDSKSDSKYSSVVRNSRPSPQNAGIDQLPEFEGFLKEKPKYVTIQRTRPTLSVDSKNDEEDEDNEDELEKEIIQKTDRNFIVEEEPKKSRGSSTPSYTNIRRSRPTTPAIDIEDSTEPVEVTTKRLTTTRIYRTRGTTAAPVEETSTVISGSTPGRYKTIERTRTTEARTSSGSTSRYSTRAELEVDGEESDEDQEDQSAVTVQVPNSNLHRTRTTQKSINTNSRTYANIPRRTTSATAAAGTSTPETFTPEVTTVTSTILTTLNPTTTPSEPTSQNTTPIPLSEVSQDPLSKPSETSQTQPNDILLETTTIAQGFQTHSLTTHDLSQSTEDQQITTETQQQLNTTSTTIDVTVNDDSLSLTVDDDQVKVIKISENENSNLKGEINSSGNNIGSNGSKSESTTSQPEVELTFYNTNYDSSLNTTDNSLSNVKESHQSTTTATSTKSTLTPTTPKRTIDKFNRRTKTPTTITTTAIPNEIPIDSNNNNNNNNNNVNENITDNKEFLGTVSSPRPFGYPRRRTRPTISKLSTTTINSTTNSQQLGDNTNDNTTNKVSSITTSTTTFNVTETNSRTYLNDTTITQNDNDAIFVSNISSSSSNSRNTNRPINTSPNSIIADNNNSLDINETKILIGVGGNSSNEVADQNPVKETHKYIQKTLISTTIPTNTITTRKFTTKTAVNPPQKPESSLEPSPRKLFYHVDTTTVANDIEQPVAKPTYSWRSKGRGTYRPWQTTTPTPTPSRATPPRPYRPREEGETDTDDEQTFESSSVRNSNNRNFQRRRRPSTPTRVTTLEPLTRPPITRKTTISPKESESDSADSVDRGLSRGSSKKVNSINVTTPVTRNEIRRSNRGQSTSRGFIGHQRRRPTSSSQVSQNSISTLETASNSQTTGTANLEDSDAIILTETTDSGLVNKSVNLGGENVTNLTETTITTKLNKSGSSEGSIQNLQNQTTETTTGNLTTNHTKLESLGEQTANNNITLGSFNIQRSENTSNVESENPPTTEIVTESPTNQLNITFNTNNLFNISTSAGIQNLTAQSLGINSNVSLSGDNNSLPSIHFDRWNENVTKPDNETLNTILGFVEGLQNQTINADFNETFGAVGTFLESYVNLLQNSNLSSDFIGNLSAETGQIPSFIKYNTTKSKENDSEGVFSTPSLSFSIVPNLTLDATLEKADNDLLTSRTDLLASRERMLTSREDALIAREKNLRFRLNRTDSIEISQENSTQKAYSGPEKPSFIDKAANITYEAGEFENGLIDNITSKSREDFLASREKMLRSREDALTAREKNLRFREELSSSRNRGFTESEIEKSSEPFIINEKSERTNYEETTIRTDFAHRRGTTTKPESEENQIPTTESPLQNLNRTKSIEISQENSTEKTYSGPEKPSLIHKAANITYEAGEFQNGLIDNVTSKSREDFLSSREQKLTSREHALTAREKTLRYREELSSSRNRGFTESEIEKSSEPFTINEKSERTNYEETTSGTDFTHRRGTTNKPESEENQISTTETLIRPLRPEIESDLSSLLSGDFQKFDPANLAADRKGNRRVYPARTKTTVSIPETTTERENYPKDFSAANSKTRGRPTTTKIPETTTERENYPLNFPVVHSKTKGQSTYKTDTSAKSSSYKAEDVQGHPIETTVNQRRRPPFSQASRNSTFTFNTVSNSKTSGTAKFEGDKVTNLTETTQTRTFNKSGSINLGAEGLVNLTETTITTKLNKSGSSEGSFQNLQNQTTETTTGNLTTNHTKLESLGEQTANNNITLGSFNVQRSENTSNVESENPPTTEIVTESPTNQLNITFNTNNLFNISTSDGIQNLTAQSLGINSNVSLSGHNNSLAAIHFDRWNENVSKPDNETLNTILGFVEGLQNQTINADFNETFGAVGTFLESYLNLLNNSNLSSEFIGNLSADTDQIPSFIKYNTTKSNYSISDIFSTPSLSFSIVPNLTLDSSLEKADNDLLTSRIDLLASRERMLTSREDALIAREKNLRFRLNRTDSIEISQENATEKAYSGPEKPSLIHKAANIAYEAGEFQNGLIDNVTSKSREDFLASREEMLRSREDALTAREDNLRFREELSSSRNRGFTESEIEKISEPLTTNEKSERFNYEETTSGTDFTHRRGTTNKPESEENQISTTETLIRPLRPEIESDLSSLLSGDFQKFDPANLAVDRKGNRRVYPARTKTTVSIPETTTEKENYPINFSATNSKTRGRPTTPEIPETTTERENYPLNFPVVHSKTKGQSTYKTDPSAKSSSSFKETRYGFQSNDALSNARKDSEENLEGEKIENSTGKSQISTLPESFSISGESLNVKNLGNESSNHGTQLNSDKQQNSEQQNSENSKISIKYSLQSKTIKDIKNSQFEGEESTNKTPIEEELLKNVTGNQFEKTGRRIHSEQRSKNGLHNRDGQTDSPIFFLGKFQIGAKIVNETKEKSEPKNKKKVLITDSLIISSREEQANALRAQNQNIQGRNFLENNRYASKNLVPTEDVTINSTTNVVTSLGYNITGSGAAKTTSESVYATTNGAITTESKKITGAESISNENNNESEEDGPRFRKVFGLRAPKFVEDEDGNSVPEEAILAQRRLIQVRRRKLFTTKTPSIEVENEGLSIQKIENNVTKEEILVTTENVPIFQTTTKENDFQKVSTTDIPNGSSTVLSNEENVDRTTFFRIEASTDPPHENIDNSNIHDSNFTDSKKQNVNRIRTRPPFEQKFHTTTETNIADSTTDPAAKTDAPSIRRRPILDKSESSTIGFRRGSRPTTNEKSTAEEDSVRRRPFLSKTEDIDSEVTAKSKIKQTIDATENSTTEILESTEFKGGTFEKNTFDANGRKFRRPTTTSNPQVATLENFSTTVDPLELTTDYKGLSKFSRKRPEDKPIFGNSARNFRFRTTTEAADINLSAESTTTETDTESNLKNSSASAEQSILLIKETKFVSKDKNAEYFENRKSSESKNISLGINEAEIDTTTSDLMLEHEFEATTIVPALEMGPSTSDAFDGDNQDISLSTVYSSIGPNIEERTTESNNLDTTTNRKVIKKLIRKTTTKSPEGISSQKSGSETSTVDGTTESIRFSAIPTSAIKNKFYLGNKSIVEIKSLTSTKIQDLAALEVSEEVILGGLFSTTPESSDDIGISTIKPITEADSTTISNEDDLKKAAEVTGSSTVIPVDENLKESTIKVDILFDDDSSTQNPEVNVDNPLADENRGSKSLEQRRRFQGRFRTTTERSSTTNEPLDSELEEPTESTRLGNRRYQLRVNSGSKLKANAAQGEDSENTNEETTNGSAPKSFVLPTRSKLSVSRRPFIGRESFKTKAPSNTSDEEISEEVNVEKEIETTSTRTRTRIPQRQQNVGNTKFRIKSTTLPPKDKGDEKEEEQPEKDEPKSVRGPINRKTYSSLQRFRTTTTNAPPEDSSVENGDPDTNDESTVSTTERKFVRLPTRKTFGGRNRQTTTLSPESAEENISDKQDESSDVSSTKRTYSILNRSRFTTKSATGVSTLEEDEKEFETSTLENTEKRGNQQNTRISTLLNRTRQKLEKHGNNSGVSSENGAELKEDSRESTFDDVIETTTRRSYLALVRSRTTTSATPQDSLSESIDTSTLSPPEETEKNQSPAEREKSTTENVTDTESETNIDTIDATTKKNYLVIKRIRTTTEGLPEETTPYYDEGSGLGATTESENDDENTTIFPIQELPLEITTENLTETGKVEEFTIAGEQVKENPDIPHDSPSESTTKRAYLTLNRLQTTSGITEDLESETTTSRNSVRRPVQRFRSTTEKSVEDILDNEKGDNDEDKSTESTTRRSYFALNRQRITTTKIPSRTTSSDEDLADFHKDEDETKDQQEVSTKRTFGLNRFRTSNGTLSKDVQSEDTTRRSYSILSRSRPTATPTSEQNTADEDYEDDDDKNDAADSVSVSTTKRNNISFRPRVGFRTSKKPDETNSENVDENIDNEEETSDSSDFTTTRRPRVTFRTRPNFRITTKVPAEKPEDDDGNNDDQENDGDLESASENPSTTTTRGFRFRTRPTLKPATSTISGNTDESEDQQYDSEEVSKTQTSTIGRTGFSLRPRPNFRTTTRNYIENIDEDGNEDDEEETDDLDNFSESIPSTTRQGFNFRTRPTFRTTTKRSAEKPEDDDGNNDDQENYDDLESTSENPSTTTIRGFRFRTRPTFKAATTTVSGNTDESENQQYDSEEVSKTQTSTIGRTGFSLRPRPNFRTTTRNSVENIDEDGNEDDEEETGDLDNFSESIPSTTRRGFNFRTRPTLKPVTNADETVGNADETEDQNDDLDEVSKPQPSTTVRNGLSFRPRPTFRTVTKRPAEKTEEDDSNDEDQEEIDNLENPRDIPSTTTIRGFKFRTRPTFRTSTEKDSDDYEEDDEENSQVSVLSTTVRQKFTTRSRFTTTTKKPNEKGSNVDDDYYDEDETDKESSIPEQSTPSFILKRPSPRFPLFKTTTTTPKTTSVTTEDGEKTKEPGSEEPEIKTTTRRNLFGNRSKPTLKPIRTTVSSSEETVSDTTNSSDTETHLNDFTNHTEPLTSVDSVNSGYNDDNIDEDEELEEGKNYSKLDLDVNGEEDSHKQLDDDSNSTLNLSRSQLNFTRRFQNTRTGNIEVNTADVNNSTTINGRRRIRVFKVRRPVDNILSRNNTEKTINKTSTTVPDDTIDKTSKVTDSLTTERPKFTRRKLIRKRPLNASTESINQNGQNLTAASNGTDSETTPQISRKVIRKKINHTETESDVTKSSNKGLFRPIQTLGGRTHLLKVSNATLNETHTQEDEGAVLEETNQQQNETIIKDDDDENEGEDASEAPPTTTTKSKLFVSRRPYRPTKPSVSALTSTESAAPTPRSYVRKYSSNFTLPKPPADGETSGITQETGGVFRPSPVNGGKYRFPVKSTRYGEPRKESDQDDEEDYEDKEEDEGTDEELEEKPITKVVRPNYFVLNRAKPTETPEIDTGNGDNEQLPEVLPPNVNHRPFGVVNRPDIGPVVRLNNGFVGVLQKPTLSSHDVTDEEGSDDEEEELKLEPERKFQHNINKTSRTSLNYRPSRPTNRPRLSNSPILTTGHPASQRTGVPKILLNTTPSNFKVTNTRTYERKYSPSSTESTPQENLLEDLNIDALNARNKKIFEQNSRKHTTVKPKIHSTNGTTSVNATTSTDNYNINKTQDTDQILNTLLEQHNISSDIQSINNFENHLQEHVLENSVVPPTTPASISTTTSKMTTLTHIFALGDDDNETGTTEIPTTEDWGLTNSGKNEKLVEINRISEIYSKEDKLKLNSRGQDLDGKKFESTDLRLEQLPTVDKLGEISRVTLVKLVESGAKSRIESSKSLKSDILIEGRSTVIDYTPTESTTANEFVRNSIPISDTSDDMQKKEGRKLLLPEVILGVETSTIPLEGLFENARKAKKLGYQIENGTVFATSLGEAKTLNLDDLFFQVETTTGSSQPIAVNTIPTTTATTTSAPITQTPTVPTTTPSESVKIEPTTELPLNFTLSSNILTAGVENKTEKPVTYVRPFPLVPLLRPESNESSPLVISIANLDKVILSKVPRIDGSAASSGRVNTFVVAPKTPSPLEAALANNKSNNNLNLNHNVIPQTPDISHSSQSETIVETQTSYSSEINVVRKKARKSKSRRRQKIIEDQ